MKKSYNDVLYLRGNATGFYAPKGGAFSSDLTTWKELADRGEPARPDALAVGRELTGFHSWAGLSGPSAPLLVQNGWTDDLFPAPEALRVYRTFRRRPARASRSSLATSGTRAARTTPAVDTRDAEQGRQFFGRVPEGRGQRAGARQRRSRTRSRAPASRRAAALQRRRTGSACTRRR